MTTPKSTDWSNSTLWYDENPMEYARRADALDTSPTLKSFVQKLPKGGRILDYGCGSGRDLEQFLKLGFDAHGIDGSKPLVALCKRRLRDPHRLRHMKFDEFSDPEKSWDGIWAMASLLHIPRQNLESHLRFLAKRLRHGGTLFACLKTGDQDFIDERGRPMSTLSQNSARRMLNKQIEQGFSVTITTTQSSDTLGNQTGWTNIEISRQ